MNKSNQIKDIAKEIQRVWKVENTEVFITAVCNVTHKNENIK
jgi:hypothetical protein